MTTRKERRERWVRAALEVLLADRFEEDWPVSLAMGTQDAVGVTIIYTIERGSTDIIRCAVTDQEGAAKALSRAFVDLTVPESFDG